MLKMGNIRWLPACVVILLSFHIHNTNAVTQTGKVYIGTPGNLTTELSFSNAENSGYLDVFIQVEVSENGTTTLTDITNNVTISCSISPSATGYSQAIFTSVDVEAPNISAPNFTTEPVSVQIPFGIVMVGRSVVLQCWGISILNAGGNETLENSTAPAPQFTKEISISDAVSFTIRRKGTVNICYNIVVVPYKKTDNTGQFLVELSEPVMAENYVTVTCDTQAADPGNVADAIQLVVQPAIISEYQRKILMSYQRVTGTGPLLVSCKGQSHFKIGNDTFDGDQFKNASSRGDAVPFVLDTGHVTLYPGFAALKTSEMRLFLVLDAAVSSDVSFACSAEGTNSTTQASVIVDDPYCQVVASEQTPPRPVSNESQADPTTTTTTLSPEVPARNRTVSDWQIRNPNVEFKEGGQPHQALILERGVEPSSPTQEFVVVTCCAVPATDNPKYKAKIAAVLLTSYLTPPIAVNWTEATLPKDETVETSIQNPAYVEVAPCPCDLTQGACDLGCCCDKTCSDVEKETFKCIPGLAGGLPPPLPQYSCSSNFPVREDWFPFMCVHKENTAFLGYYFFSTAATRSEIDFNAKANAKKPMYSYKSTTKRSPFPPVNAVGYKQGDNIRAGLVEKSVVDNIITRDSFQLGLPKKSLIGECVDTSPIRYLEDTDTDCQRTVTKDLCHSRSVLSASVYAQSTYLSHPPCPKPPVIIKSKGTKDISEVTTNFLCISYPDSYLKSPALYRDFIGPNQKSLFANPDFDASRCGFDPVTRAYECSVESNETPPVYYNLTRCLWDDSYTRAPSPVFNESTSMCNNAVIDVFYNFTWKGGEILVLNATYILADLPTNIERVENYPVIYEQTISTSSVSDYNLTMNANSTSGNSTSGNSTSANVTSVTSGNSTSVNITTSDVELISSTENVTIRIPAVLKQKFKVVFWQEYKLPNISQESNTPPRIDRYQRSGKIGYDSDKPVLSGVPQFNESTGDFFTMMVDDKSVLSMWRPGPSGLCADAGRQGIQFTQDGLSSCSLKLGLQQLHNDCNDLRKEILNRQDALMRSLYISRNGDPVLTNLQDWIQILRENISHIVPPEETDMTTVAMTTTVNMTTATDMTTTPESTTDSLNMTLEAEANETSNSTSNETGPGLLFTETIGRCPNIPSGIHVDIMYAQSGAVNSLPQYEIVAAKVSYTLSEWQLVCMGSLGEACLGNLSSSANTTGEEAVQTFHLTSSIRFILVPSQQQPPQTRSQVQEENERFVCKRDACWGELLYPILPAFLGNSLQYTTAVAMTTSLFILGYFFLTKPWW